MTPPKLKLVDRVQAINWNRLEDDKDLEVWDRLTGNFWLPEKIPLSNDIQSWNTLKPHEQQMTTRVFTGLTLLDTVQGTVGAVSLIPDAVTPHEEAVYTNIAFMESVHAKSYSSIFSTLISTEEIDETFRWSEENDHLQTKAKIILDYYRGDDPEKRKVASTMLESFLFYSGFFLPLWLCGQGEMVASADIIKKIIADESIHGVFVGLIAQDQFKKLKNQDQVKARFLALLYNLYENELKYTEEIYTEVGLTAEVKEYVRYNANMNLGFDPIFEVKQVNPIVLNGLNTETTQHDFFSKKSTNYEKATEIVHLKDDDFKMDVVVDI